MANLFAYKGCMNHFERFNLPTQFTIDEDALNSAYRAVQTQVHPDRFATASNVQKQRALQYATQVNEAYRTLKDPLSRAIYLLQLHDIDPRCEDNTAMPPDFLMQQLAWHERIEEAAVSENSEALDRLLHELRADESARFAELPTLFNTMFNTVHIDGIDPKLSTQTVEAVRQLMFIKRVASEADKQLKQLEYQS